jgi:hypothetical protein
MELDDRWERERTIRMGSALTVRERVLVAQGFLAMWFMAKSTRYAFGPYSIARLFPMAL